MDSGKALDDDGASSQVSWFQGSMLPAGSFSIVLISNHHPVHSTGLDYRVEERSRKNLNFYQGEDRVHEESVAWKICNANKNCGW